MTTRLSVGISAYNQGKYLRATLESLLAQEVPPYELVVSNDHSTDETASVLADFRGRVRVISPPHHLNIAEGLNYVLNELSGDWLAPMASDDVAKPNYVRVLLEGTTRSKNAVAVSGGWEFMDACGAPLEIHYLLSARKLTRPPETLLENLTAPKRHIFASAFKRTAWEEAGGIPAECKFLGDWGLWLRLSSLGDFICERKVITGYRTGCRPGQELERLAEELRAEERICTVILREAAQKAGLEGSSVLAKARRQSFTRRLCQLSRLFPMDKRAEVADSLRAWAKSAGAERELEAFRSGKVFKPPAQPFRSALRKAVRKISFLIATSGIRRGVRGGPQGKGVAV